MRPGSPGPPALPATRCVSFKVKEQRARPTGAIDGVVAGQVVANIILGQQDVARLGIDLRLVFLHPQDLGRGETGQGVVAGDLDQVFFAQPAADLVALRAGALVVPEHGRAQDRAVLVQQHQAVHLARSGRWRRYPRPYRPRTARAARMLATHACPPVGRILAPTTADGASIG